jgi:hypothetical protein
MTESESSICNSSWRLGKTAWPSKVRFFKKVLRQSCVVEDRKSAGEVLDPFLRKRLPIAHRNCDVFLHHISPKFKYEWAISR